MFFNLVTREGGANICRGTLYFYYLPDYSQKLYLIGDPNTKQTANASSVSLCENGVDGCSPN